MPQFIESPLKGDVDQVSISANDSDEEAPGQPDSPVVYHSQVGNLTQISEDDEWEDTHGAASKEPQLYLCDGWVRRVEVIKRSCALQQLQDKLSARVAKNFLLVTLTSLNVGYGSLIEDYQ